MQTNSSRLVILGTGGTIAGRSAQAGDNVGYRAGEVSVADLVAAVPALANWPLEHEQLAQLDSKDMDHVTWQRLAQRAAHHLARPEVVGVVVTHGTDTLEETAWFLQRVLAPDKPLVLTAAMRPATALMADGPQNLQDAATVARCDGARGVLCVVGGQVWSAEEVCKGHPYRVDAFHGGDAGPLALVREGAVQVLRPWPEGQALGLACVTGEVASWPRVDIVCSHAGADGALVQALLALGSQGLVVEGTGNGTVHQALLAPLQQALAQGVAVLRASRCQGGAVVGEPVGALPSAGALSPGKARVELLLRLLTA